MSSTPYEMGKSSTNQGEHCRASRVSGYGTGSGVPTTTTNLPKSLSQEDVILAAELKEEMTISSREAHVLSPARDVALEDKLLYSPLKIKQEALDRQAEYSDILLLVPMRRVLSPTTGVLLSSRLSAATLVDLSSSADEARNEPLSEVKLP